MNADVVCHTLEFCHQGPGQALCHLYPLPKVSEWLSRGHQMAVTCMPFGCVKASSAVLTQRLGDRKRQDDIFNYIVWKNGLKFQKKCLTYYAGLAIGRQSDQLRTEEVYIPLLIFTCLNIKQVTFRRWSTHPSLPRTLLVQAKKFPHLGKCGQLVTLVWPLLFFPTSNRCNKIPKIPPSRSIMGSKWAQTF